MMGSGLVSFSTSSLIYSLVLIGSVFSKAAEVTKPLSYKTGAVAMTKAVTQGIQT